MNLPKKAFGIQYSKCSYIQEICLKLTNSAAMIPQVVYVLSCHDSYQRLLDNYHSLIELYYILRCHQHLDYITTSPSIILNIMCTYSAINHFYNRI